MSVNIIGVDGSVKLGANEGILGPKGGRFALKGTLLILYEIPEYSSSTVRMSGGCCGAYQYDPKTSKISGQLVSDLLSKHCVQALKTTDLPQVIIDLVMGYLNIK